MGAFKRSSPRSSPRAIRLTVDRMPKYTRELNDYIEIVRGRLRLNRLAHLHSPTPTGLEAAIHLAVEDLHRKRQQGPCFGATALGPSRWTKVQFLSSPPWKIRHSQLPQLQSKWQAYNICLCGIRSRRRHGMRRAVDVAPHGFLSYILPARTSVAFAAGNFGELMARWLLTGSTTKLAMILAKYGDTCRMRGPTLRPRRKTGLPLSPTALNHRVYQQFHRRQHGTV
jgi:hypothetical protein